MYFKYGWRKKNVIIFFLFQNKSMTVSYQSNFLPFILKSRKVPDSRWWASTLWKCKSTWQKVCEAFNHHQSLQHVSYAGPRTAWETAAPHLHPPSPTKKKKKNTANKYWKMFQLSFRKQHSQSVRATVNSCNSVSCEKLKQKVLHQKSICFSFSSFLLRLLLPSLIRPVWSTHVPLSRADE